jgi:DAK2 domain fusion protein YloV
MIDSSPDEAAAHALLARVRVVAASAHAALAAAAARIDDLNVYPVPDGDTGSNMSRTAAAVVEALSSPTPPSCGELPGRVSEAALAGSRGNSGIILSQIVRGVCSALAAAGRLDGGTVAEALRQAAELAYRVIDVPVEGTMLTVVREAAERAARTANAAGANAESVLEAALAQAEDALSRTPRMLPQLARAGVVDAGGAGVVELMRGALAGLRGEAVPAPEPGAYAVGVPSEHGDDSRYRYCTSFMLRGEGVDPLRLKHELAPLGDCLVVVGEPGLCKVHVHTDDPGAALSLATAAGALDAVEIANMHDQTRARDARLAAAPVEGRRCDVVCVASGAGNRALFAALGARAVVDGGQSMNPSTGSLLEAVDGCAAEGVVILPNNANVVLAAQQAAQAAARPAFVVPTRSLGAGLSALVGYDADADAAANAAAMGDAIAGLRAGSITRAVRDASLDGLTVRHGDLLVLVEDVVVATAPDGPSALRSLAGRLLDGGAEILTVLLGKDADEGLRSASLGLADAHPGVEVEVREGGQPHYHAVLAAE